MKHAWMYVLAAGLLSTSAFGQIPTREPSTAEEVIARHIAAMGGEARLRAVPQRHTVKTVQLRVGGGSMAMETELYFLGPDKVLVRGKSSAMGDVEVGFDGQTAWMKSAAMGTRELAESERGAVREAVPEIPSWAHARTLTYVGRRDFEGAPMHVISWSSDTIGAVTEYFDVRTGLRRAAQLRDPASGTTMTSIYSDYSTRDGYTLPLREDTLMGKDTVSIAIITTFNHTPIAASMFTPPAELRRKSP